MSMNGNWMTLAAMVNNALSGYQIKLFKST